MRSRPEDALARPDQTGKDAGASADDGCDPTIVEAIGGELSPGRFAISQLPVATGSVKVSSRE